MGLAQFILKYPLHLHCLTVYYAPSFQPFLCVLTN
jgi:hypothetical protein